MLVLYSCLQLQNKFIDKFMYTQLHITFAPLTLQKTITKEKHQKHLHHTTTQIFLKKKSLQHKER
jgi:hypothetical protein